ncbi:hypothetical protein BAUCODRAFT_251056 [Baudoinia panamericana UAMH 10762]|uniref:Uncharacterized protein n=1 Tax=Baudoinia panamericana (strain UAMH 10762) TaxID=717646 RepID=M2N4N8_BAUPA|nr:uncharacterized protein BAUCODRAFT_251056 [Baudoinia panamericana UAMH 10762]EMC93700.1 hypothetical protein BAUCODRAFT_251056 [Baudoinia panamericana UAMH 10762]
MPNARLLRTSPPPRTLQFVHPQVVQFDSFSPQLSLHQRRTNSHTNKAGCETYQQKRSLRCTIRVQPRPDCVVTRECEPLKTNDVLAMMNHLRRHSANVPLPQDQQAARGMCLTPRLCEVATSSCGLASAFARGNPERH